MTGVPDYLLERARAAASRLPSGPLALRRALFAAQGRHVVLPEAEILADVFSSAVPYGEVRSHARSVHDVPLSPRGAASFSPYCLVAFPGRKRGRDRLSLDVRPRPGVADLVARASVLSDGYSLYWEVVVFDDHAVVYSRTSQIIASRVVAVVHPRSVPR